MYMFIVVKRLGRLIAAAAGPVVEIVVTVVVVVVVWVRIRVRLETMSVMSLKNLILLHHIPPHQIYPALRELVIIRV